MYSDHEEKRAPDENESELQAQADVPRLVKNFCMGVVLYELPSPSLSKSLKYLALTTIRIGIINLFTQMTYSFNNPDNASVCDSRDFLWMQKIMNHLYVLLPYLTILIWGKWLEFCSWRRRRSRESLV